jgi:DNA polymerase
MSKNSIIHLDFETYSECHLKNQGMWRYAEHPTTEAICFAYQVDEGPLKLWTPNHPIPKAFQRPYGQVWGWNVAFEAAIWERIMVRQWGFPAILRSKWRDTMALAAYFGFPLDLDRAAFVAGKSQKNPRGIELIKQLCGPIKPTKTFPFDRRTPETHPELFEEFYQYCKDDVAAEHDVHLSLPRQELPELEQRLWYENFLSGRRGVTIDVPLVQALQYIRDYQVDSLDEEICGITNGISATQPTALGDWINRIHGIDMPDMTKESVTEYIAREDTPDEVRRVLEIRQEIGKTSVKKLDKFMECLCDDGTVKGALIYYGAGTGRFAGRLFQLHNLPRGSFKVSDDMCDAVIDDPDEAFDLLFDRPMDAISTLIRPCLIAEDGTWFYDADYSAIEARGTAWVAGQESMLLAFRKRTPIYEAMAAKIFDIPIEQVQFFERFVGKQAVLGLGYQMGWLKFYNTCLDYGQDIGHDLAKHAVKVYRGENEHIVNFWYTINDACMTAIRNTGKVFVVQTRYCAIRIVSTGKYMFIQLPSGRTLTYLVPRISVVTKDWGDIEQIQYRGLDEKNQWRWIDLYGGKLTENIVQAVARDVMRDGIFRVIDAGFEFKLSVHDQILCQSKKSGRLDEYVGLMTTVPDWANGFPIAAEGKECLRFSK